MIEEMIKKTKPKKEYSMLQLDKNIHEALKQYCSHHGFIMKSFVQSLIRQAIKDNKSR